MRAACGSAVRLHRALSVGFLALFLTAINSHAQTDPLPSWNDGPAKQRIVDFVRATTEGQDESITVYDHMFPIRGAHEFGSGAARFGAGRTGHSHQGQDVFAACGTPLVAARGGKVRFSGFHSAAGYYVVIDGKGTGADNAYMHLRERADVQVGDRVYTGQEIGAVGDTGDAVGCHLHFEEWTAPGWYEGGRPIDPLPDLKRWDRTS